MPLGVDPQLTAVQLLNLLMVALIATALIATLIYAIRQMSQRYQAQHNALDEKPKR